VRNAAALLLVVTLAACAPPPPVVVAPASPMHPEYVFPEPPPGTPPRTADRLTRGWWLLQANDVAAADREFTAILRDARGFPPAVAAQGYVELARRRPEAAIAHFDRAAATLPAYAPALVGRGLALLADGRDDEALTAFQRAYEADADVPNLAGRIQVLQVRQLQNRVSRAERAAAEGRWDDARAAYRAAIEASPESAFLHRDLARAERRAGDDEAALTHARRALELDDEDARAHAVVAEVLEARGDYDGALAAYQRVEDLAPSPDVSRSIARLRERARDAALPAQYHAIAASSGVTRGDLAALIGVRLGPQLASLPQRQVVVTDIRSHWARTWIEAAARAGVIEVFPNYTFQPAAPLRRADLAEVVSRLLALLRPERVPLWDAQTVTLSDVPPGHLAYPAVRRAVASGVMRLDGAAFRLLQPVTGADITGVLSRLEALRDAP
jgi:tetratricopeptide (TPR) repeat protein